MRTCFSSTVAPAGNWSRSSLRGWPPVVNRDTVGRGFHPGVADDELHFLPGLEAIARRPRHPRDIEAVALCLDLDHEGMIPGRDVQACEFDLRHVVPLALGRKTPEHFLGHGTAGFQLVDDFFQGARAPA